MFSRKIMNTNLDIIWIEFLDGQPTSVSYNSKVRVLAWSFSGESSLYDFCWLLPHMIESNPACSLPLLKRPVKLNSYNCIYS